MSRILICGHKTVFINVGSKIPSMLKNTKPLSKRICDLTVSAPLSRVHVPQSGGGAYVYPN
jgi:hypothetical protein